MKTLYLQCGMGAAGDMFSAALLDLLPEPEAWADSFNSLGLPGVRMEYSVDLRHGVRGSHIRVLVNGAQEQSLDDFSRVRPDESEGPRLTHERSHSHEHSHSLEHAHSHEHSHSHCQTHEHAHTHSGVPHTHGGRTVGDIRTLIDSLPVSDRVKADANAVYRLIANAEAEAHGCAVEQVHFCEVGDLDAVADILAACLLMESLSPESVVCSPIHVGSGYVRCSHGSLPVPAPATASILRGVPIYGGNVLGELCTPTGAALLRHFVHSFGPMPPMTVAAIGCGTGTKLYDNANCLRAFLGESALSPVNQITEITCNLDDMTPEAVGFCLEQLLEFGVLDAFVTPIQMKRGRPAFMLTCLLQPKDTERISLWLLQNTSATGLRRHCRERATLTSRFENVHTAYGIIPVKISEGYGIIKAKPEYRFVSEAAARAHAPFKAVYDAVMERYASDTRSAVAPGAI